MRQIEARFIVDRGDFKLDVELALPGQGVSALFGPSGSGKTTCLRALAGLERLPNSRVIVDGEVWQDEAQRLFKPPHQRAIGYVFQEASLFPHLTVEQNLMFGFERTPVARRQVAAADVVALLGIDGLLARRPAALSGGERQRVAIARALLTSPKLLLMDEPLSALDLALKREILPYLEALHSHLEIPIVYVSHSAEEVARLADHICLLERGRLVASGPLTQVMLDHRSARRFGEGASTVWQGRVILQNEAEHLTQVQAGEVLLNMSQRSLVVGEPIRCRIFASDVSLCLSEPMQTSIMNRFDAEVTSIDTEGQPGEALVTLALAGGQPLNAQISLHSLKRLNIQVGSRLWAQVKSVAVL